MLSGKAQAGQQPYAYGSLLQAATYGLTIPVGYGMTISPLLATWTANLRQGGSTKKFKQMKKGGPPTYCENITFLLGHNPVVGVNQMWNNGGTQPMNFVSQTFTGAGPWTITDPHFYAVIGVSVTESYSVAFNDFGAAAPVSAAGTYQVPLWNELMNGPDPIRNSGYRNYPFCYRWQPSYGATVQADATDIFSGATVTVYYAQLTAATSYQTPLVRNRLHFENVLGNGDEYNGFSGQQILYPMFAGCGSASIDLGTGGVIPQLQGEIQFKWGMYSSGDADFADMIEDIFKSGLAQAAIGATTGTAASTPIEHGLSAYNYPGCIQMKCLTGASSGSLGAISYNMPVTIGNFLVVTATTNGSGGSAVSIASTPSLTWTPVLSGSPHNQVWRAQATATGPMSITVSGQGNNWGTALIEIGGVDTFDAVQVGINGSTNITASNAQGFPEYLLSIALYPGSPFTQPQMPLWTLLTPSNTYGQAPANGYSIQERRTSTPGVYNAAVPTSGLGASLVLAFKCVNPPTYPNPLGDFIDFKSLDLVRLQCRANGLWGSLSMASQQGASDYLDKLYQAADAAPVFLGFRLYSYPYSEVSAVGNGAIYHAPTATGPIASLSANTGDFLAAGGSALLEVKTAARINQPNVLQLQCINRTSNYNPSVVSQPDQGSIAIYGIRKADPVQNYAIQDVGIGRKILAIAVRKLQYGGDVYTFQAPAKWALLSPMDLIYVSDPLANINTIPVRITSVSESAPNSPLDFEAEPFVYGMYNPSALPTDTPVPFNPSVAQSAGNVNCPIIFQPTTGLQGLNNQAQLWMVVSSPATNYGGAQVYVSTDGGSSYTPLGDPLVGSATTGRSTGDWPAAPTPDTTNNLALDLSESAPVGTLLSYSSTTQDGYQYPCLVQYGSPGGAGTNASGGGTISNGDPTGYIGAGVLFGNWSYPGLPCDAVITGIYPTITIQTTGAALSGTTSSIGTGLTPVSGGVGMVSYFGPRGATQYHSLGSIGTSFASLSGIGINCCLNLSNAGQPQADMTCSNVGLAIIYTSANATIDPTIPNPFTVPPGSGLVWSLPLIAGGGLAGTPGGNSASSGGLPGVPSFSGGWGYELMTYGVATLTGTNLYTLQATGGGGNHLNRGVYGAPQQGVGVDHPTGSRFAFLNPSGQGILKVPLPNQWVGQLLYFKICSYNNYGAAAQSLSDVPAYSFMPTAGPSFSGGAGGVQLFQVNGV